MWSWLKKCVELETTNETFVIATIASVVGSVPREVGAKMIVAQNGEFWGTIGGGGLEKQALTDVSQILTAGLSRLIKYPLTPANGHACGGVAEVFFEIINPKPRLIIFGAGHVGTALSQVMCETKFKVYLVDERSEWIDSPKIPSDTMCVKQSWEAFLKSFNFLPSDLVVIMTHAHTSDFAILAALINTPLAYLGVIGSKRKRETFKNNLISNGISEQNADKFICPIGSPDLGKTPKEISIGVGQELLSV